MTLAMTQPLDPRLVQQLQYDDGAATPTEAPTETHSVTVVTNLER